MAKLIIKKTELKDPYDIIHGALEDNIVDHGRWNVQHELIFKWTDGKVYRTFYSVGATEYQPERAWMYEDEIKCEEVKLQRHSGFEWVPVDKCLTEMVEGDLYENKTT